MASTPEAEIPDPDSASGDSEAPMADVPEKTTCQAFLQWALPQLGLRWPGFRRVHRLVCKRVGRRLAALRLVDAGAYRSYLDSHPEEWQMLDSFCRIPISRLMRDRAVFEALGRTVLPELARATLARGGRELRAWSAGCASGEEPHTLRILWQLELAPRFPTLSLAILATDVDAELLERTRCGCYGRSSLRELPLEWLYAAFTRSAGVYALRPEFRHGLELRRQDLRAATPDGPFDLVLCRNLAFTYFDAPSQRRALARILSTLRPGGALVIGLKERLPEGDGGVERWVPALRIYRKAVAVGCGDGARNAVTVGAHGWS